MPLTIGTCFIVVLVCVLDVSQGTSVGNFYGGSISYTVKNSTTTGKSEIHLDVITGWKLGQGPCGPGCGNKDVGKSTMVLRNTTPFGNWSEVIKTKSTHGTTPKPKDITSTIIANAKTHVLDVSEKDGWEQELLQSTIQLDDKFETIDIIHKGMSWHDLEQGSNQSWTIQTKIKSKTRNDTGNLNNSPFVIVSPMYRVELNAINTIKIHAVDPDDDFVKCREAEFNQVGGIKTPNETIIKENCEIILDTSVSNGYHADSWIALAVGVDDYSRYPIKYGTEDFKTAQFALSSTTVQFLVKVMSNIQAPSFVDPTLSNGHEFDVYLGATWTADVYAKPEVGKTIDTFTLIGRQQEQVQTTAKQNDPVKTGVVFTTLSWKPKPADIGPHVICVRVVDTTGIESLQDRCLLLKVKENAFNKAPTVSNGPYFIDFPTLSQVISCTLGSTCVFPVFIKSTAPIQIVKTSNNPQGTVTIGQTFTQETHNNESVYTTELSFMHDIDGAFQVCIVATDINGKSSDETCVNTDVIPPDPCLKKPCKNSADCHTNTTNRTDYTCTCVTIQFYGKDCEKKTDPCKPDPCFHGAPCFDTFPTAYCYCSGDWKGSFCNETENCSSQPTNGTTSVTHTASGMKVGDTTTYTCNTGYEHVTSPLTIKCLLSGEWELPTCSLKDCGQPSPGTHSTCSPNSTTTYGSSAMCTCDKGYTSLTFTSIMCRETGTWDTSPTCSPKDCTNSLPVRNHTTCVVGSATTYGSISTCTCEDGYVSTSTMNIKCLDTGLWDTPPKCLEKAAVPDSSLNIPVIAGAGAGGVAVIGGGVAVYFIRKIKLRKLQVEDEKENEKDKLRDKVEKIKEVA